ncbi:hypothetical protein DYB28_010469, partial [Aphanomyces astaci]
PVILGALKDKWAPNCGSVYNELDEAKLNPKCSQDKDGLRNVLFFSYAWLLWAVLTWAASFLIARYRLNHRNTKSQDVETPVVT